MLESNNIVELINDYMPNDDVLSLKPEFTCGICLNLYLLKNVSSNSFRCRKGRSVMVNPFTNSMSNT